jgi:hypothetical protein
MFGLIPHGYTAFDNLLHLVLGGLSLAVAWWFFGAERGGEDPEPRGKGRRVIEAPTLLLRASGLFSELSREEVFCEVLRHPPATVVGFSLPY